MEKTKFVDIKQQIIQIREFCRRATDMGGVLLVSGSRGLGKTRLVDEALNDRRIENKPGFCNQLFGDVSDSKRLLINREPNKVSRHIIKIDVDPYFPYAENKKTKKSDSSQKEQLIKIDVHHAFPADENTATQKSSVEDKLKKAAQETADTVQQEPDSNALSVALIRNIVVGLTTVLDCRCSHRLYGKTLTAKLGFWDYWFSDNALLWRENDSIRLYCLVLPLIIFSIIAIYFQNVYSIISLLLFAFSPLIAWILLRWRDWRALHAMSEKLYALVHADESGEHRHFIEESKHNKLLLPALGIALVFVLIPQIFKETLPFVENILSPIGLVQAILASALVIGITWASSRKTQKHAEFNQNNPVWMITLLKRYLYLCHRCGLEPVLVFDELDKLEDMNTWWHESLNMTPSKNTPTKLNQFLLTLARLKSSLGAEFLWVLIGGSNVYSRLQQARHSRPDGSLGLLATTIHQEVLVGPLDLESAKKLELYDQSSNLIIEEKNIKTLWLKSYGNLATLNRNHEKQHYSYHIETEQLASKLAEIWAIEMQLDYIDLTSDEIWLAKLREDWVQNWIHTGMLVFANDLLKKRMHRHDIRNMLYENLPKSSKKGLDDIEHSPEIVALQSEHSAALMTLGKKILLSYLTAEGCLSYENRHGEKSEYMHLTFSDKRYISIEEAISQLSKDKAGDSNKLVGKLRVISEIGAQKKALYIAHDKTITEKLNDEEIQYWIHQGMFSMADNLLNNAVLCSEVDRFLSDSWASSFFVSTQYTTSDAEKISLETKHSDLLMALGKKLLICYLNKEGCLSWKDSAGVKMKFIQLNFPTETNST